MDELFYKMIFKRKSFHIFTGKQKLKDDEIVELQTFIDNVVPLNKNINVKYKIVDRCNTSCPRGEYCILLYSEEKENYLNNIGYIGEQIDLYLASKDIGVCWYGLGKTDEIVYQGLPFIIMLTIEKVSINEFRKDMYKSKRKELSEIWMGNEYLDIANIVRFTPSSCNTQPWIVEAKEKELIVYRYKKEGKRGMMPLNRVVYSNRIDMGIFLLFLELCLKHNKLKYDLILYEDYDDDIEKICIAKYIMER